MRTDVVSADFFARDQKSTCLPEPLEFVSPK
jgi:hypothetical protein